jgi:hypothetical protein
VIHIRDEDGEASLNRQILSNSVKRKGVDGLCEKPRKLIHKELRSQDLHTVAYEDVQNIFFSLL